MENVRKHIDFQLVSDERRLQKLVSTPGLKRIIRYTNDLVGLSLRKKSIVLSRPVYVDVYKRQEQTRIHALLTGKKRLTGKIEKS